MTNSTQDTEERLEYIAAVLEANADKFAVPDHISAKVRDIRGAAQLIHDLHRVLEIVADEDSWRGFSPVARLERIRQLAADATLFAKATQ